MVIYYRRNETGYISEDQDVTGADATFQDVSQNGAGHRVSHGGEMWLRKTPLVPLGITGTDQVERWNVTWVCDAHMGAAKPLGPRHVGHQSHEAADSQDFDLSIHASSLAGKAPPESRGRQEHVLEKPKCCVGNGEQGLGRGRCRVEKRTVWTIEPREEAPDW